MYGGLSKESQYFDQPDPFKKQGEYQKVLVTLPCVFTHVFTRLFSHSLSLPLAMQKMSMYLCC